MKKITKAFEWVRTHLFEFILLLLLAVVMALPVIFYTFVPYAFTLMLPIDLLFADLLPIGGLLAAALFFKNRFLGILFVLTAFLFSFCRIGMCVMYKMAYLPLTYDSMVLLYEHIDHDGMVAMIGKYYAIWTVLAFAAVAAAIVFFCKKCSKTVVTLPENRRNHVLVITLILIFFGLHSNSRFVWQRDILLREDVYSGHSVTPLSFLLSELAADGIQSAFHCFDPIEYGYRQVEFHPENEAFLTRYGLLPGAGYGEVITPAFDRIVILAMESLDSDFIGAYNPEMPEGVTPNIDAYAREYLSFDNYYGASMPTSWGIATLILSRLDYYADRRMNNISLCTELRKNNIPSFYFSPISGEFGENRKNYRKMFDYDDGFFSEELKEKYPMQPNGAWGFTDPSMFQAVLTFLRKEQMDKYFIVVSTMDTHFPYTPTGPLAQGKNFSDHFHQTLHATDRNIADFIREFMNDNTLFNERTLLVITADHPSSHGENRTRRSTPGLPSRIPLILISKDNRAARYFPDTHKLCSSIDFPVTLLAMSGLDIPETFMGSDMRTKAPFALGKDVVDNCYLFLPDRQTITFYKPHPVLHSTEERAFYEFLSQYYRLPKLKTNAAGISKPE